MQSFILKPSHLISLLFSFKDILSVHQPMQKLIQIRTVVHTATAFDRLDSSQYNIM